MDKKQRKLYHYRDDYSFYGSGLEHHLFRSGRCDVDFKWQVSAKAPYSLYREFRYLDKDYILYHRDRSMPV